jgi:hypothetical protein
MKTKLFSTMAFVAIITLALIGCGGNDTTAETFTVTFHANGGTPEPEKQTIEKGKTATEPQGVTKANNTLEGWYKETAFTTKWNFTTDTVTTNVDLYARWDEQPVVTTLTLIIKDVTVTVKYQKKPSEPVPSQINKIKTAADGLNADTTNMTITVMNNLKSRGGLYVINVRYGGTSFDGFSAIDGRTLDVHDSWLISADDNTLKFSVLRDAFEDIYDIPVTQ